MFRRVSAEIQIKDRLVVFGDEAWYRVQDPAPQSLFEGTDRLAHVPPIKLFHDLLCSIDIEGPTGTAPSKA